MNFVIEEKRSPTYEAMLSQAEGTGLEPATGYPAPHFQCDDMGDFCEEEAKNQASAAAGAAIDAELGLVIDGWPSLSAPLRLAILAIVRSTAQSE